MPAQDVNIVGTIPEGSEVAAKFMAAAKVRIKTYLDNSDTYLTLAPLKVVLTEAARELRDADRDWYYIEQLFRFINGLTQENAHLFLHYLGYYWVDLYCLEDDDVRRINVVDFIEGDVEECSKRKVLGGLVNKGSSAGSFNITWWRKWDTFKEDFMQHATELGFVTCYEQGFCFTEWLYFKKPSRTVWGRFVDRFVKGHRYE